MPQHKLHYILTHCKEGDPQQSGVELAVRYEENPSGCHIGDTDGQHPEQSQERLPSETVPHGTRDGGSQQHQHQAHQHLPFGQDPRLVEVPPEAEGGQGLDVQLVRAVWGLGHGEMVDHGTELILPALGDDVLHHGPIVAQIVGYLNGPCRLHLLVPAVGGEGHTSKLVANEGHTPILHKTCCDY